MITPNSVLQHPAPKESNFLNPPCSVERFRRLRDLCPPTSVPCVLSLVPRFSAAPSSAEPAQIPPLARQTPSSSTPHSPAHLPAPRSFPYPPPSIRPDSPRACFPLPSRIRPPIPSPLSRTPAAK